MAARISDALRVPRRAVDLRRIDPGATPRFNGGKAAARKATEKVSPRLAHLQERLFAEGRKGGTRSVLLVLQGEFLLARNAVEAYETGERIWGNVQYVQRAK